MDDPPRVTRLGFQSFDAASLWSRHPPRIGNASKLVLFDAAGGIARRPVGTLRVARYDGAPASLPPRVPSAKPAFASVEGAFSYAAAPPDTEEWHLNFANAHLFCAYGAAAFAQDEIQVAEHPVLGSLLEALSAERYPGLPPLTSDNGTPTPILVHGVERWCAIDLDPDLAAPYGIYGQRLRRASEAAIRQAVHRLPTGTSMSNVIAMEAPQGSGRYTEEQLRLTLVTAYCGFAAAREMTSARRVVVHTGHWGTGAHGGDPVLMATLQIAAASLAQLDGLTYHSFDATGQDAVDEAVRLVAALAIPERPTEELLAELLDQGFVWGTADGN